MKRGAIECLEKERKYLWGRIQYFLNKRKEVYRSFHDEPRYTRHWTYAKRLNHYTEMHREVVGTIKVLKGG